MLNHSTVGQDDGFDAGNFHPRKKSIYDIFVEFAPSGRKTDLESFDFHSKQICIGPRQYSIYFRNLQ